MFPLQPSLSIFRSSHFHQKSLLSNCALSPTTRIIFRPLLSTFSFGYFRQILLKLVSIYTTSSLQPLLLPTITVSVVLSLLSVFFWQVFLAVMFVPAHPFQPLLLKIQICPQEFRSTHHIHSSYYRQHMFHFLLSTSFPTRSSSNQVHFSTISQPIFGIPKSVILQRSCLQCSLFTKVLFGNPCYWVYKFYFLQFFFKKKKKFSQQDV